MRVPVCPKCGTVMNNSLFMLTIANAVECPKCHFMCTPEESEKESMYIPDEDVIETRAGLEGVEAMVQP